MATVSATAPSQVAPSAPPAPAAPTVPVPPPKYYEFTQLEKRQASSAVLPSFLLHLERNITLFEQNLFVIDREYLDLFEDDLEAIRAIPAAERQDISDYHLKLFEKRLNVLSLASRVVGFSQSIESADPALISGFEDDLESLTEIHEAALRRDESKRDVSQAHLEAIRKYLQNFDEILHHEAVALRIHTKDSEKVGELQDIASLRREDLEKVTKALTAVASSDVNKKQSLEKNKRDLQGLQKLERDFKLLPIAGDGECLFRACAVEVIHWLVTAKGRGSTAQEKLEAISSYLFTQRADVAKHVPVERQEAFNRCRATFVRCIEQVVSSTSGKSVREVIYDFFNTKSDAGVFQNDRDIVQGMRLLSGAYYRELLSRKEADLSAQMRDRRDTIIAITERPPLAADVAREEWLVAIETLQTAPPVGMKPGSWGDHTDIIALAEVFGVTIQTHNIPATVEEHPNTYPEDRAADIHLGFSGAHYDGLARIIRNA